MNLIMVRKVLFLIKTQILCNNNNNIVYLYLLVVEHSNNIYNQNLQMNGTMFGAPLRMS